MESNRLKRRPLQKLLPLVLLAVLFLCSSLHAEWQAADGPLMTRWAKKVSPKNAHPEYPRPQMVRKDWLNLNGLWQYAIRPEDRQQPDTFDGDILVPFPTESALSGVMKAVGEKNRLWYRRQFEVPKKWAKQRMLLHFGAVDWDATVFVNGRKVGNHRGGYDPFTFEITEALNGTGPQEIVLSVWDPTNTSYQPRGKQVNQPRGIWYTAVTGIWQTVWLEPVPQAHIESIKIVPDIDNSSVHLIAACSDGTDGYTVEAQAKDGWFTKGKAEGRPGKQISVSLKKPKLWSPNSPFLYDLIVTLKDGNGKKVDSVSSYFGMRKIEVRKDRDAVNRLFLNNKPLFQFGPLDQGWWPDGLYTAPTDAALRYDIEVLKKLGCNMLRKHVKVEPARLYYWCDKLGLMVWQDMPSGDKYIRSNQPDIVRSEESAKQYELEWSRIIQAFYNHPCIVMWVPFNEGWGQFDTARITELTKTLDPTRLVDSASGWTDRGVGDVQDIHRYPGPAAPATEKKRAAVLGEFGGLGLPIKGHTWQDEKNWGYRSYKTREELTDAYLALIDNLRSLIGSGLAAAVYTQTTDVEIEVNGLMTYDRAMIKASAKKVAAANKQLYMPPPSIHTIVFTSEKWPKTWQYTTSDPGAGWEQPDFDDSGWKAGKAGFGTKGTPGAIVKTEWKTPDIWLRRSFELKSTRFSRLQLLIHHDENAEVYINGQLAAKLEGHTSSYVRVNIDEKAAEAMKIGTNCLAVHCHQTTGGQYIDTGIVDIVEP